MKKMFAALAALGFTLAPAHGGHHVRVTFAGYAGRTDTLHNFPALVEFSDPSKPFFDATGASDLRFYDEGFHLLAHEIDTVEPGKVLAWVKVPELAPDGKSGVLAVWGDDPATLPAALPTTDVWSADFKLVLHFNEAVGNAVLDASGNGNHGKIHAPGGAANGVAGRAANLSAGFRNNGILLDNPAGVPIHDKGAWTISAWFCDLLGPTAGSGWRTLARGPGVDHHIIIEDASNDAGSYIHLGSNAGLHKAPGVVLSTNGVPKGTWRHIAAVGVDGNPGRVEFYVDGDYKGKHSFYIATPVYGVGCYQGGDFPNPASLVPAHKFADYLDEFRIAQAARPADWIWAEVQNQSAPAVFADYEVALGDLRVLGNPPGVGVVEPAFGEYFGVGAGSNIAMTVAGPAWTNAAGNVVAVATNWVVEVENSGGGLGFVADGSAWPFTYAHPVPAARGVVTWNFAVSNLITATAGPGGRLSVGGSGWCGSTEVWTLEAEPDPGGAFLQWTGDVPGHMVLDNPLHLPGDKPRTVAAAFKGTQHVATLAGGGSDANSGLSFLEPKLTLVSAVAALGADGGVVLVAPGRYGVGPEDVIWQGANATVMAAVSLTNAVAVCGATGNPDDVTVFRESAAHTCVFHLNHPGARVENMTVSHGLVRGAHPAPAGHAHAFAGNIHINGGGGTVSNCVITAGATESTGQGWYGGGVYLGGADGLVTHCVIRGNTSGGSWNWYGGGVFIASGRLENSLVADNARSSSGAANEAGGVYMIGGCMVNCTVARNSCRTYGGAYVEAGVVVNTVIAGNMSVVNSGTAAVVGGDANAFHNCFTDTPGPVNGSCANAPAAVLFSNCPDGDFTPAPGSPLIDASMDASLLVPNHVPPLLDLAGHLREMGLGIDAGCFEANPERLAASFASDITQGFAPAQVVFTASIGGADVDDLLFTWDFGDHKPATVVAGRPIVTNDFETGGFYPVTLTVSNLVNHQTVVVAHSRGQLRLVPPVIHVVAGNPLADEPYDTKDNAAPSLRVALDYTVEGCEILVWEGVHSVGALYVDKRLTLRGATGNPGDVVLRRAAPDVALLTLNHAEARVEGLTLDSFLSNNNYPGRNLHIDGFGGTVSNCVLRNGGLISGGFGSAALLTTGNAVLSHCVVSNNYVHSNVSGWAYRDISVLRMDGGRVENCLFTGNRVTGEFTNDTSIVEMPGGILRNCTFAGNLTTQRGILHITGGGAVVENCVIAGNVPRDAGRDPAPFVTGHSAAAVQLNTCTVDRTRPAPNPSCNHGEPGDIYKDYWAGDYRLKAGSPAVNRGARFSPQEAAAAGVDLDGLPRVVGGRLDNGCYEYQSVVGTLFMIR